PRLPVLQACRPRGNPEAFDNKPRCGRHPSNPLAGRWIDAWLTLASTVLQHVVSHCPFRFSCAPYTSSRRSLPRAWTTLPSTGSSDDPLLRHYSRNTTSHCCQRFACLQVLCHQVLPIAVSSPAWNGEHIRQNGTWSLPPVRS